MYNLIYLAIAEYNYGVNRNAGFDFSVGAFQIGGTKTAQIILNINNDRSWISVIISYIITARDDMSLGFFALSGFQFNKVGNNANQYEYKQALTDFNAQNQQVTSFALLSGFRTAAKTIPKIQIRYFRIDTKTAIATLRIDIDIPLALETIFFSYIWWIRNTQALKFSAFNIKKGSSVTYQYPAANRIINNKYSFIGLGFAGTGSTGAISCVGASCNSQCMKLLDCFSAGGIIANKTCFRCGNG